MTNEDLKKQLKTYIEKNRQAQQKAAKEKKAAKEAKLAKKVIVKSEKPSDGIKRTGRVHVVSKRTVVDN